DLVCVQQQLAGAGGRRVVVAPGEVGRDAHSLEPHLAVADVGVRLSQAGLAGSQRLDFRSREHEAGLPSLQEVVVMSRPRVAGDWDFVHSSQGKIETTVEAVKPRVDLGLYRALDSPFRTLAEVVELVDALASGASGRKPVGVRVPPSAFLEGQTSSISADSDPRSRPTHRSRRAGCAPSRNPPPSGSPAP